MSENTRSHDGVIDSHQHFWQLRRADYGWLQPSMTALYRDFEPRDLEPLLDRGGVQQTVLVQAAPTIEETRFLLDLAHRHPFIAGVVGWVDLEHERAAQELRELAADAKLIGIRPMVQDLKDSQWLLRPALSPAMATMIELGLTFEALVRPSHLPTLLQFCNRYPELTVVVDHAAKPDIAAGDFATWARDLEDLANSTSAYCKLSGLVTEAGNAPFASLKLYVDHMLDCFGADRVMWGSDWPVCESVCTYQEWLDLSRRLTQHLNQKQVDRIFCEVARKAYRLVAHTARP